MPYLFIYFIIFIYFNVSPFDAQIIHLHNLQYNFIVDNICGIGKIAVPDEFKNLFKSSYSPYIEIDVAGGFYICIKFEEYIIKKLDIQRSSLKRKLYDILYCDDTETHELLSLEEVALIIN